MSRFIASRALLSAFLLGAVLSPVWAQQAPATVPSPQLQSRTFRLRNIRPSLVAFWLDAAHQPMPIEIQSGRTLGPFDIQLVEPDALSKPVRLPGNGNGPLDLRLPSGITRLVSIDPQNVLQATGTPEALNALETLLPALDVPLVQLEIVARFVEIERADFHKAGLKFEPLQAERAYTLGALSSVPVDFETRLEQLIRSKRARVLTAPRVTLIDGLGGELKQTLSTPVAWNDAVSATAPAPQRFAYIQSSIGLRASATRLKDDRIALNIEPRLNSRILSLSTTVRDDQSFALQMSPSTEARQLIVIVTTHRVRREGETN